MRCTPLFRVVSVLLFCAAVVGCKPSAPPGPMTGAKTVRCVFIRNESKQGVTLDLSFNEGEPERIVLPAHQGIFVFDPLPPRVPYSKLVPTEATLTGPDGIKAVYNSFVCELSAVDGPKGTVKARGSIDDETSYTIPDAEFLDTRNLSPQAVPKLRRVDVTIVPTKAP